jgi:hypothetical protein
MDEVKEFTQQQVGLGAGVEVGFTRCSAGKHVELRKALWLKHDFTYYGRAARELWEMWYSENVEGGVETT